MTSGSRVTLQSVARVGALLLAALLLSGCAVVTPYQSRGLTGGYTEQRLADDVYHVTFGGNGNTPKEVVERYFMYRCAELTKEKGYKYFVVVRTGKLGALQAPIEVGEQASASPWRKAGFAGSASENPAAGYQKVRGTGGGGYYYIPGGVYRITTWSGRATIRLLNDSGLKGRVVGYVAEDVMRQLQPYIKDRSQLVAMPGPSMIDPVLGVTPLRPVPESQDPPKADAPASPEAEPPTTPDKAT